MSFAEWKEGLTAEQKEAMDLHVRQLRNKSGDQKQYARYVSVLGKENVPKTFDKFQELKYTKVESWNGLKKSYKTIGEIERKPWNDNFKGKARKSYFEFKDKNIEMSSHAISRFLSRKDGANGISYTFDDIVNQCHMRANYKQSDGREVKFYNSIAIIYNNSGDTVVSIVNRKHPKSDWSELI